MKQGNKITRGYFYEYATKLAVIASSVLILDACAGKPEFTDRTTNSVNDGSENDPHGDGVGRSFTPGSEEEGGGDTSCHGTLNSSITPQTHLDGTNVVFLIDDSGSMSDEISRAKAQVGNFISNISNLTNDNYRIVLIFDESKSAFGGTDPFTSFYSSKIKHIKNETGSSWADLAFFKSFAQLDFHQTLSNPVAADCVFPFSGWNSTQIANVCTPIDYAATCASSGDYYRPRYDIDGQENWWGPAACYRAQNATSKKLDVRDYLLADRAVNFIVISDDDLDASYQWDKFDFYNYDRNDSEKNAYLETVYNMMTEVLKPLGTAPIYYHSIVGLPVVGGAHDAQESHVDETGWTHLSLSKKTGGAALSITASSYQSAFEEIKQKIAFSQIAVSLPCEIGENSSVTSVKIGSRTLSGNQFSLSSDRRSIALDPAAFQSGDEGSDLPVEVVY